MPRQIQLSYSQLQQAVTYSSQMYKMNISLHIWTLYLSNLVIFPVAFWNPESKFQCGPVWLFIMLMRGDP